MGERFLIIDAITRTAQAELTVVESCSFGEVLNSPGSFKATIPLVMPVGSLITSETIRPPRAVFAYEKDDVLVWAGPIWTHSYDLDAGTVELAGEGYLSYLRRRILRISATYTGIDQFAIAFDLIDKAQAAGNGYLGISYTANPATSGVLRDRTYYSYERKHIGTLIEQLAAVQNGFDFRLMPRWSSGPNSTLVVDFLVTYPPVGRATDIVFDLGAVDFSTVTLDGTSLAFTVDAIGRGEGDSLPISTQTDSSLVIAYMALDDDISVSDVEDTATLAAYAQRRLLRGKAPIVIPKVQVGTEWLGRFVVGDQVRVRAAMGLLQLDAMYRIVAYDFDLPANGPALVTLSLSPLEVFQ